MPKLTPYICCKPALDAIDFYTKVYGGVEKTCWKDDDGRVSHAEIEFGDSRLFLADEHPEIGVLSPLTQGGYPVLLVLEVTDADRSFERALAAGATVSRPLADEPYGRVGKLRDPFGHEWMIIQPPA